MPPAIPFDSLVLSAVCSELQDAVGSYVKKVWQSDDYTLLLKLTDRTMVVSCDPRFFRIHFTRAEQVTIEPSAFLRTLKEKIEGGKITAISQPRFDRALHIVISRAGSEFVLKAELLGTRSNILLDEQGRTLSKMRKMPASNISDSPADLSEALRTGKGLGPFLQNELQILGEEPLIQAAQSKDGVLVEGEGVYPYQPAQLEKARSVNFASLSEALDKHYSGLVPKADLEHKKKTLAGQLQRALDAKSSALTQVEAVLDTAARARDLQMQAELLLAYANDIKEGARLFETFDYEQKAITIKLNPVKTALENAEIYFQKAKRAKVAAKELKPKSEILRHELSDIKNRLQQLEDPDIETIEEIEKEAIANGWLRLHKPTAAVKEKRPYEGHKIREALSPAGFRVLWAENATSNDYLTTKIAKPNDYWMHVRGAAGSHVVIQTANRPDRVQPNDLAFAAQIAAKHSGQKHARNVPVTYTLAKYVRKPRKAAPGAVTLTNDKTIFVNP